LIRRHRPSADVLDLFQIQAREFNFRDQNRSDVAKIEESYLVWGMYDGGHCHGWTIRSIVYDVGGTRLVGDNYGRRQCVEEAN
jgi:hypothetical protein